MAKQITGRLLDRVFHSETRMEGFAPKDFS
jgi:hypothetical protein